jgi:hypothetical protein
MGPSKTPTAVERDWLDRLCELSCIACRKDGIDDTPGEVHHIVQGNRRLGHLFTLLLCPPHHRGDGREVPSVHFTKRTFVQRYGSELELLDELQIEFGIFDKVIT